MDDLIERMDAIDVLKKSYVHEDGIHYWRDHNNDCIDKLIKKFNLIPSADRPRGEWIDRGIRVPSSWVKKCSLCGHETDTWRWCNFCPNCGARMKGADDECGF